MESLAVVNDFDALEEAAWRTDSAGSSSIARCSRSFSMRQFVDEDLVLITPLLGFPELTGNSAGMAPDFRDVLRKPFALDCRISAGKLMF